ncbi:solute carrier family 39 (zinc transporter), member 1/2/3 [Blastomyces parvus]|uniref:Solute carrier family 39 (Zinc transporter), member 1/2/3 n=1 Tax=Blastomyces parvus TaxID=2060905 RepID=A0A2B7WLW0_9EURO|nr:solute carrier family 39 (zinc transporter), member 1/2/3 [Blastomyces parvus]
MVCGRSPISIGLLLSCIPLVASQTFSNCHSRGGTVFCIGPDGKEIPIWTQVTPTQTQPPAVLAVTTEAPQTTAVTACHAHSTKTFCIAGDGQEVQVTGAGTPTTEIPAQYTDCHTHDSKRFCVDPNGDDVQILLPSETSGPHDGHGEKESEGGENCHFHAGVEHCVGEGQSEGSAPPSCERRDRDYNIPLRIGSLFVILATSAIAVFGPMLWARFFNTGMNGVIFTVIKQFGTGIMVSTAFIHLLTHAHLMFSNPCVGTLKYEATTGAIAMAGIFLSFLVEYAGNRFLLARKPDCNPHAHCDVEPQPTPTKCADGSDTEQPAPTLANLGHHHHTLARPDDKLSVVIMEAGIIFHSIIIGLTLVVAGDSGYVSLFIVIIFHQMFEGLALGARIAQLGSALTPSKLSMAAVFALITPIGMAIGLGVIHQFNGNDRSTIIAIGTLDALSAGILSWVALIDMWSHDWLYGDLRDAGIVKTGVGLLSLVAGMVLMGLLGKWA